MSLNDIPKILYKYRSFQENIIEDNRYQRQAFAKGEIYFSSYKELNDPFDLGIRKKYELMPKDDILLHTVYHLAQNDMNLSFKTLWDKANSHFEENIAQNNDYYKQLSLKGLELWQESIDRRIHCMSEKNNDILMWSHYANSNQGFCLGYNSRKLALFIEQKCRMHFLKVHYSSDYPEIKPQVGKNEDDILKRLTSKANSWSYEKEWRLIIYNLQNPVIQIPDEIVEEIILGAKTLPETEKEILAIQKQRYPNARVFKVKPDDSEFKLNISPYNR